MNINQLQDTINTDEVQFPRTRRTESVKVLTSCYAGKIVPLKVVPLLREDYAQGQVNFDFEMMETAEMLMNGINVSVQAHFVSNLCFERFGGSMHRLNKSYSGLPDIDGADVVPFVSTSPFDWGSEFNQALGLSGKDGELSNDAYIESYNQVVNMRLSSRSPLLPLRDRMDQTLAKAFWRHQNMGHIVPDFDSAKMDGEVPLNVVATRLPVTGIGKPLGYTAPTFNDVNVYESTGNPVNYPNTAAAWDENIPNRVVIQTTSGGRPQIFAEMEENGITVSLANIDMARKTQAFANIQSKFKGLSGDDIVSLLMQGIRVPEEELANPILVGRGSTIFGYSQRYATNGDDLQKSVTNGVTSVPIRVNVPPQSTGGVIIFTAEIVPEMIFERKRDYYLTASNVSDFPNALADTLDPEKVSIVQKSHIDVEHNDPDGVFGYAPLNHEWQRNFVNVGGKYRRQAGDPFDEDRQKIWANESPDPELTEDFYVVNELHHKVFVSDQEDPFEILASGEIAIGGLTQFGKALIEATTDFDQILEEVDQTRIDQGV